MKTAKTTIYRVMKGGTVKKTTTWGHAHYHVVVKVRTQFWRAACYMALHRQIVDRLNKAGAWTFDDKSAGSIDLVEHHVASWSSLKVCHALHLGLQFHHPKPKSWVIQQVKAALKVPEGVQRPELDSVETRPRFSSTELLAARMMAAVSSHAGHGDLAFAIKKFLSAHGLDEFQQTSLFASCIVELSRETSCP